MKCYNIYLAVILLCCLDNCLSINDVNLKRKNANGFRVLMSKNYVEDIGDFLLAFLKTSKIDKKVISLSNCLNNVSKTLSSLSVVTQTLSNNPNIISIMSVLTNVDQVYKNAKNNKICKNITSEFKNYINSYIDNPKIGKGDARKYYTNLINMVDKNYEKIYFQMMKTIKLYKLKETTKSGNLLGETVRNLLRLRDFNVNLKDTSIIKNMIEFKKDAKYFKDNIVHCEQAINDIIPDIYNYYKNTTKIEEMIPNSNDLIKSLSEATKLFKCIDISEKIFKNLFKN